ncbi:MAG: zinc ABC transporter substrate-binding protein [Treponema sp.]|nr:zinc ABC transporter substrate-binding protein [Treponema sp.]
MSIKKFLIGCAMILAASATFAKTKIVTTIFPEYDWVKQIVGDKAKDAEITLLIGNGVDLHSYQPSIQDIAKISTADIFIYVGGESDGWVEDALKNARNKNMKVINLMEVLGDRVKEEEVVEGMQEEDEHEHSYSSEIDAHDIKDRKLSEFNGEWQSLYPVLMDGGLGEYVEHQAEENGKSEAEMKKEIAAKWNCGVKKIKVSGDKISITYDGGKSVSGKYSYAGYAVKKNDEGKITNVRYKFESKDKNVPRFVMFNDHGYAPAKEVAHFHFYFGNNSFEEFMNSKVNSYFVDSKLSAHECEDLLLGHNHSDGHHHHSSDEEELEYDEHVWLSVRNAKILCAEICNALCAKDSKNAATYKANYASYSAKLDKLDSDFAAAVRNGKTKTLLFGDRFPFRYLVDDYGLKYYAAFVGCSAETEASFETIVFLAKKVDEFGLKNVCQIESGNGKIARTIIESSKNKNAKILTLDSMQSVTQNDIKKGATYLGTMQKNLEVLKEALK